MTDTMIEFERTLLSTMMFSPSDCWRVDVQPHHFLSEQHGEVMAAIRALSADSSPVDPLTVSDYFAKLKKPSLAKLVLEMGSGQFTTPIPDAYSQRIMSEWRLRQARAIGSGLVNSKDPAVIDAAIESLMGLHVTETKCEFSAKEAARAAVEKLNQAHSAGGKLPGITTGIAALDDKLGGFHDGDLIVVGGRAAMGKTSALLGFSVAAAKTETPVGIISGEQPADQMATRMVSAESRLSGKTFRTAGFEEHEWPRVFRGFEVIASLPIWMLDRSAPTLTEIVRVARRWVHQHGIKALYIDYLQRIVGEGERRYEQVGNVAKGLKNLARDLNIPVIVLAQVSRAVEGRQVQKPRLSDLSDSSEIEKEADQVLMLYRAGYYDANADQGRAEIIVEKNRHGPTGYVETAWHGETMTFHDLAHDADADRYGP